MKKSLLILTFAAFAVGATAQRKDKDKHHSEDRVENAKSYDHYHHDHDKDCDKKHHKKNKKYTKNKNYKNGHYAHRPVNRGADRPINGGVKNGPNNGQVNNSNGVPNVVVRAFNRDHPNAQGVLWTSANTYWTASYVNGIFRPTATYKSNGQRVS